MTLDEAIKCAEEAAEEYTKFNLYGFENHDECAKEHRQLTEWLRDYKRLKEQEPILDKITEIIEPLRQLALDEMSNVEWQILQIIDKYREEQEDNGFFDEIMDDESDGEVYEKIKEIIDKVKEQE
jgi:hypothetical protein